ncbi:Hypothetical protein R9X50_00544200 [Acrodontium crateriforme]|uniref:MFS general substrate transporter n=1 Tax=Acrodontium crateriforme TaxID=150365 RepID=A0AAQ3M648_9PEZI|nr:Hypothetical protein R9X50_00544200 [Acrodontium crateriforme]
MVVSDSADSPKSAAVSRVTSTTMLNMPTEDTPLLERKPSKTSPPWRRRSVVLRVLFTAFLVTLSFAVTQVPLIYVFGVMTCDEYYKTHPEPPSGAARCRVHEIQSSTAQSVALLGASTALFGVFNLFFTGWNIKAFGVKWALLVSVFFPAIRLAIQNVGVQTGGALGIIIIQASQIITVLGGPNGYMLALNSFAAEVVEPEERTATLGRLTGCSMFGTAVGYLAGGYLGDIDIIYPFRVTLALFLISCTYVILTLPTIHDQEVESKAATSFMAFFDPLKMLLPKKWILKDGTVQTEYGTLVLGIGTFLGVLATSYIPVLLQMYSTDIFGFGTAENGWLISINSLVRGLFLTLAFPVIISRGRKWLDNRNASKNETNNLNGGDVPAIPNIPAGPDAMPGHGAMASQQMPMQSPQPSKEEATSFRFDLMFTKYSLLIDGMLTGLATFTTKGYEMYIIAVMLPLASGTGPASKGTILAMCPASQRADALSAISLVDLVARMATTGAFGVIFSAFAEIGRPNLTFTCNAAFAAVGFIVLLLARFPPDGARRFVDGEDETEIAPGNS